MKTRVFFVVVASCLGSLLLPASGAVASSWEEEVGERPPVLPDKVQREREKRERLDRFLCRYGSQDACVRVLRADMENRIRPHREALEKRITDMQKALNARIKAAREPLRKKVDAMKAGPEKKKQAEKKALGDRCSRGDKVSCVRLGLFFGSFALRQHCTGGSDLPPAPRMAPPPPTATPKADAAPPPPPAPPKEKALSTQCREALEILDGKKGPPKPWVSDKVLGDRCGKGDKVACKEKELRTARNKFWGSVYKRETDRRRKLEDQCLANERGACRALAAWNEVECVHATCRRYKLDALVNALKAACRTTKKTCPLATELAKLATDEDADMKRLCGMGDEQSCRYASVFQTVAGKAIKPGPSVKTTSAPPKEVTP